MRARMWWVLVVAGVASGAQGASTVDVFVFDFDFSINPAAGEVLPAVIFAGDTIRWVFVDEMHNTVACVGQAEFWESDVFMAGETFVYTFETPGVFNYYCAPHGADAGDGTYFGMGSSITVLPVPGVNAIAGMAAAAIFTGRRRRVG